MSENRDMLKSVTDSECSEMWRCSDIDLGDKKGTHLGLPDRHVGKRPLDKKKSVTVVIDHTKKQNS